MIFYNKRYFFVLLLLVYLPAFLIFKSEKTDFKKLRLKMVKDQIAARGIKNKKVLDSLKKVPRHIFVSEKYRPYAYHDRPLPIGHGQTISQPYIVALMTDLINVNKKSKVLEVGTGSGYQAAVLAAIVRKVYTIEIVKGLYKKSSVLFKKAVYKNVSIKFGDGYYGWKKYAPYDAIIVTCAAAQVPPPLIKQLKVGGVMCIPVGPPFQVQNLLIITKKSAKKVKIKVITQVRFVPLVRKD